MKTTSYAMEIGEDNFDIYNIEPFEHRLAYSLHLLFGFYYEIRAVTQEDSERCHNEKLPICTFCHHLYLQESHYSVETLKVYNSFGLDVKLSSKNKTIYTANLNSFDSDEDFCFYIKVYTNGFGTNYKVEIYNINPD